MKKIIVISILFLSVSFAQGQVFIGTEPTGNPVLLEVSSRNKGVLIPRINIPDISKAFPVGNPKTGLLVMNTHKGTEGLFFWNGRAWEKLKTIETTGADLRRTGNVNVFVGLAEIGRGKEPEIAKNKNFEVPLKAYWGTATDNGKSYTIQEDGVYEISGGFTGIASNTDAIASAYIWKNEKDKYIACTTASQPSGYLVIAAKVIYCGPLKKGDKIGLILVFAAGNPNLKSPKLKTANLSVKKIHIN
jgi:hypothetical protein